jgi:hypothetical protein
MTLPLSFMLLEDEKQAEVLDLGNSFTDMTRAGVKVWPASQVALLMNGGQIIEIGTVTRSRRRIATDWHRLRYVRQRQMTPLSMDELLAGLPARFRSSVGGRATSGGVLTERSAAAVVAVVEELRPEDGSELRRLIGRDVPAASLRGDGLQSAAQEADAVRLAIDIAGIPRKALRDVRPDGKLSFLAQLEEVRASEDPAIAYDGMRFLDFDSIASPSGIVTFASGHERLTVVNVNRQPLERTTGADLIYINEVLESFVLVQYKTMRYEGDETSRLVYRPDAQLRAELERMRKIKPGADDGSPDSFRLNPSTCFLKLCKPVVRLDRPQDLVTGMYLPLAYYDVLAASDTVRGPRKGLAFSYENVGRHVGNDLFVALVRGGWVGSRGASSKRLKKLVLAGLDASRSVTVAAASRGAEFDRTDR